MSLLTDAEIEAVITKGVRAGEISWLGYKKDDQGAFTLPVLSKSDYQAARAIEAATAAKYAERIADIQAKLDAAAVDAERWRALLERLLIAETTEFPPFEAGAEAQMAWAEEKCDAEDAARAAIDAMRTGENQNG